MRKLILLSFLLLTHVPVPAQDTIIRLPDFPENRYEGGPQAFYRELGQKLRYPPKARQAGIIGTTILAFTLTAEGEITDIEIVNSLGKEIDKDITNVFARTKKKWLPEDNTLKVRMYLPITYIIDGANLLQVPMDENLFIEPIRVVTYSNPTSNPGVTPREKLIEKMYKALEKEKHKAALTYVNHLIRRDPFNKQWFVIRSTIYKEMGEPEAVCSDLSKIQNLLQYPVSDQLMQQFCR